MINDSLALLPLHMYVVRVYTQLCRAITGDVAVSLNGRQRSLTAALIRASLRLRGRRVEERTAVLHVLIRLHFTDETSGVDGLPRDTAKEPNRVFVFVQSGFQQSERVGREEM